MNKIALIGVLLSTVIGVVHADMGKHTYDNLGCSSCHGADGKGIADKGNNLTGRPADELASSIKRYRDNKGQHKESMAPADNCDGEMTDADVSDIAKWLSNS